MSEQQLLLIFNYTESIWSHLPTNWDNYSRTSAQEACRQERESVSEILKSRRPAVRSELSGREVMSPLTRPARQTIADTSQAALHHGSVPLKRIPASHPTSPITIIYIPAEHEEASGQAGGGSRAAGGLWWNGWEAIRWEGGWRGRDEERKSEGEADVWGFQ